MMSGGLLDRPRTHPTTYKPMKSKNFIRTALILLASALASATFSSCNTARGIGTDVRSAGRGIERASDRAR